MEGLLVLLSFVCMAVGIPSVLFLGGIQPLWVILDIAVNDRVSKASKIILLLLILIGIPLCIFSVIGIVFVPLLALIPLVYGLFFTPSAILKKASRLSVLILVCALIGLSVTAILSSQVRDNIRQYKDLSQEGNSQSLETGGARERSPGSTDEVAAPAASTGTMSVDPFRAILHVSPDQESIAEYGPDGFDEGRAMPVKRPSIYPLNHLAVDPAGPYFYGVTTHMFGRIDSNSGDFEEIEITDQTLPRLSWPAGIAFDRRRKRLVLTSRGALFFYYPETNYWEAVADSVERPIVYGPDEDLLYSISSDGSSLVRINMRGAIVRETALSMRVPMANTWEKTKVQLCWSSGRVIVLAAGEDAGLFVIDPASGNVDRQH